jgi:hypothetical protein
MKKAKAKKTKQPDGMVCADCGVVITEEEQQRDSYRTKPAGVFHHYNPETCEDINAIRTKLMPKAMASVMEAMDIKDAKRKSK